MAAIVINGIEFASKAAAKEIIQDILRRYQLGEMLNPSDMDFMFDVLCAHENAAEKIGVGVTSIGVRINPTYGRNKEFVVYRRNGTKTDFSYLKCLTPPTHRARFIQACRQAIAPGMIAFARASFQSNPRPICPFTGEILTPATAHVDHIYPHTFRHILEAFLHETRVDIDRVELSGSVDNSCTVQILDRRIEKAWLDFHWKRAKLRVISAKANMINSDKEPLPPMPQYMTDDMQARRDAIEQEMLAKGYKKVIP